LFGLRDWLVFGGLVIVLRYILLLDVFTWLFLCFLVYVFSSYLFGCFVVLLLFWFNYLLFLWFWVDSLCLLSFGSGVVFVLLCLFGLLLMLLFTWWFEFGNSVGLNLLLFDYFVLVLWLFYSCLCCFRLVCYVGFVFIVCLLRLVCVLVVFAVCCVVLVCLVCLI